MNKYIGLILLFNIVFISILKSQTTIQGTITNAKGQKLSDISILLLEMPDSTMVSYTFSDTDGNYKMSYPGENSNLMVCISGMEVAPQSKKINNQSQKVDFTTEFKFIDLKEVVVKSSKIWGGHDTINYLVSAFSDEKDQVIGDVLKKMPGIEVSGGGQISFQGKPINKFYIENLDMLEGRYGIATNNISAKDVSTVQVLENHQPIKVLDSLKFSSSPAINIKLKDSAKGNLSIMATLGLGAAPLLWNNKLVGMYFSKKRQNITTYKGNNSGQDLSNELTSYTQESDYSGIGMTGIRESSPPGINKDRYYFNNSHAVTVNNLFVVKKDKQLKLNLIYLNDQEKRESNSKVSYLLPGDSSQTIVENLNSKRHIDRLETEVHYEQNQDDNYVIYNLNASGFWENTSGDVTNLQTIHQSLYHPTFNISNGFYWIKKGKKDNGFEIRSDLSYKTSPQDLVIRPGSYSDLFTQDYAAIQQDVRIHSLKFNNNLSLLSVFKIGEIRINPSMGLNLDHRTFQSELYPIGENGLSILSAPDSMKNELRWMKSTLNLAANASYDKDGLRVNLSLPANLLLIQLNNLVLKENRHMNRLYFQPNINIVYTFSPKINISGNYSFYNQTGDLYSQYTGFILQDYRSLNRYNSNLTEWKGNGGSVDLSYKELISMLFCNIGASTYYQKMEDLYGQNLNGIISTTIQLKQPNASKGYSINGKIGKGLDLMNLVTSIETSYGSGQSQILQQNEILQLQSDYVNLGASVDAKPTQWMIVSYKGDWGESFGKAVSGEKFSPIQSMVNKLSLTIDVIKDLGIEMGYEHYFNSAAMGNKNFSLADMGLTYRYNRFRFELGWSNILNTDKYVTAYYNGLNTYYSAYRIRPQNVLLKVSFKLK